MSSLINFDSFSNTGLHGRSVVVFKVHQLDAVKRTWVLALKISEWKSRPAALTEEKKKKWWFLLSALLGPNVIVMVKPQHTCSYIRLLTVPVWWLPPGIGHTKLISSFLCIEGGTASSKLLQLQRTWDTNFLMPKKPLPPCVSYLLERCERCLSTWISIKSAGKTGPDDDYHLV